MNGENTFKERLGGLALSDNGFLFDTWTGCTFTLNPTGTAVLRGLQQGLSPRQIGSQLATEFEVDMETATTDVNDFVHQLVELKVLDDEVPHD